jgi:serine/threonine protein kinase
MFQIDLSGIGAQQLEAADPRQIGAFPIKGVLGSGGMGRVYLGVAPEGYAAVKQVLPHLATDATFLKHFGQELDNQARLPAGVSARLLAADRTARPPWFATAYIPGVTLHESVYLNGGPLPTETVWTLLRELAQHLKRVAALEMVHRDLKPSNVMLTGSGVTLIDFGVARAADQSTVTATGMIVGTPAYMAPEQARAMKTLTPAVDVFSLGAVVSFAATGEPPFGLGSGTDLLFRIVHEPPNLDALRARDSELADVVASCLAKDPAQRPSAAELLATVDQRTVAGTGDLVWPEGIAEQIAVRTAFAATAGDAAAATAAESAVIAPPQPAWPATSSAESGTVPVGIEPVISEVDPAEEPRKPRREKDRGRRRLLIILPLILATGTVGTLIGMNKVPFITSGGSDLNPTVSVSTPHSGTEASGSAAGRATATTAPSAHSSSSASSQASKGAAATTAAKASSGSGSGGTQSGSGSSPTTTAASATTKAASGGGSSNSTVISTSPGELQDVKSGDYCLEYSGGNLSEGSCTGSAAFSWYARYVTASEFEIVSNNGGSCLLAASSSSATIGGCTESSNGLWVVLSASSSGGQLESVDYSGDCFAGGSADVNDFWLQACDQNMWNETWLHKG